MQEAIDFINSGSHERAFVPTAMAIEATAKKAYQIASVSDSDFDRFFTENWQLIAFMGMPRALPLPMNIPYGLKRLVPSFDIHCGAKEIVSLAVTLTLRSGRMPAEFAFNSAGKFELKGGNLLLPSGSVCGLLGSVIFHTSNKDESIGDHYWINISDFKMFVSELFGRRDLADRILRFYRE
ncbi:MAG TPA: hypothetical protein VJL58_05925 [Pyrinomonadaceae bacterium]|nr:hypothetical protein [Pyrinomonadaceae bacterium]